MWVKSPPSLSLICALSTSIYFSDRPTNQQTNRQTNKLTDRQTNRQTDRQTKTDALPPSRVEKIKDKMNSKDRHLAGKITRVRFAFLEFLYLFLPFDHSLVKLLHFCLPRSSLSILF